MTSRSLDSAASEDHDWHAANFPVRGAAADPTPALVAFVNTHSPRDASGLFGTVVQKGAGGDYTLYVWARADHSGKIWRADPGIDTSGAWPETIRLGLSAAKLALIGVIQGGGGHDTDNTVRALVCG